MRCNPTSSGAQLNEDHRSPACRAEISSPGMDSGLAPVPHGSQQSHSPFLGTALERDASNSLLQPEIPGYPGSRSVFTSNSKRGKESLGCKIPGGWLQDLHPSSRSHRLISHLHS